MMYASAMASAVGFLLSLYTVIIEYKLKKDPSYQPACNISDRISCTKPFSSQFAQPLGISNGKVGLLFYTATAILSIAGARALLCYAATSACIASVMLAYVLYFRIKTVCLVCSIIYVVNFLLLFTSYNSL